jgi:hypothetical protein
MHGYQDGQPLQRNDKSSRKTVLAKQRAQVQLAVQVDRKRIKAMVLQRMKEHAHAMHALRVAGALQIQQRPLPVMIAMAAWSGQQHVLWKLRAWNVWRGYCQRRLHLKSLLALLAQQPGRVMLQRALCAWTHALNASRRQKGTEAVAVPSSTGAAATTGAAASSTLTKVAAVPDAADEPVEDAEARMADDSHSPHIRRPLEVTVLPKLWREPLQKATIMEAVPQAQRLPQSRLLARIERILQHKVRDAMKGQPIPHARAPA